MKSAKEPIPFLLFFFFTFILCSVFATNNTVYAKEPDVEAQGAILMDHETGRVLWEKNAHEKMAMASTTKIMTAILALENASLKDTVTVSKRASLTPKVRMGLDKDEKISLEALMHALMLQSSNDAAVAIAEHIGGSVESFCGMMTEKAKSLGAVDTVFETPNGLDSDNHYSTAYDMAVITRHAMANSTFMKIINTPDFHYTGSEKSYSVSNKNRLLKEFDGAIGVKTGYTGKAGHCFVGSAKRGDLKLISVVLASGWGTRGKEQKWKDSKDILSYGFSNFVFEDIIPKGGDAGFIVVDRSKTSQIGLHFADGLRLPLKDNESSAIRIEKDLPETIQAPIKESEIVGVAKIFIDGKLSGEIDILASGGVERHDLKTSAEKVIKAFLELGTDDEIEIVLPEF